MLRNYKFIIAYDGTRFFGWERQPGRDTIQGKLESVLSRLQGSPLPSRRHCRPGGEGGRSPVPRPV